MFGTAYYAKIQKIHVIFAYKRKQIIIMEENYNFLDENSYFFLKLLYFLLNFGKIIVFCTKFWTFKQIIFRSAFFWFRCFSHRNRNHKKHRNRNLRFRSIPTWQVRFHWWKCLSGQRRNHAAVPFIPQGNIGYQSRCYGASRISFIVSFTEIRGVAHGCAVALRKLG